MYRKLKKWQSRNKEKSLFDLIAIFLINFPALKPTKANSANPRNVIVKRGRSSNFIFPTLSLWLYHASQAYRFPRLRKNVFLKSFPQNHYSNLGASLKYAMA